MTMARTRVAYSMEDLADFLRREVERTSYRDVELKTKVSRGALENIIRKTNKDLPTIETLTRIAKAYDRKLWEVVQSVVDLELPQSPTERGQRMAAIVDRQPSSRRRSRACPSSLAVCFLPQADLYYAETPARVPASATCFSHARGSALYSSIFPRCCYIEFTHLCNFALDIPAANMLH